jgi:predicted ATP-dependent serine protease
MHIKLKRLKAVLMERFVPTGVEGLDNILGGGFPSGSLIVLAGCPGTGKTIFSAQFLHHGCVNYGESGVYASFAESKEVFYENMESLGFYFRKLEEEGKFRTLKDGFKVFPPFKVKQVEKPQKFKPQPDTAQFFSTGSPELDAMLGGGYPRGSAVLMEIEEHISTLQYHLILSPTCWNFLTLGRGVIVIPSAGVDHNLVRMRAEEGGLTRDEINRLLRVCVKGDGF